MKNQLINRKNNSMKREGNIYKDIELTEKELEEPVLDRKYIERKPIKTWEEFKAFTEDVKFKIAQEVEEVEKKRVEDIFVFSDSLGISKQKFEDIKLKREPEILKIKRSSVELGFKVQETVDKFSNEIKEKMIKGESPENAARQKEDIQAEINEKIRKIQEVYEEFVAKMEEIKRKINEILLNMEDELRGAKIEEVRENINKI